MTLFRCPRCQVQVCVSAHSGDFVHECNSGNLVFDQEDVPIIGPWTDYTGSDFSVRTGVADVQFQNLGNKVAGTEAWVRDNTKVPPFTIRGNNALINRQRQHLEYIEDPHQPMG